MLSSPLILCCTTQSISRRARTHSQTNAPSRCISTAEEIGPPDFHVAVPSLTRPSGVIYNANVIILIMGALFFLFFSRLEQVINIFKKKE